MHKRTEMSHAEAMQIVALIEAKLAGIGSGAAIAVADSHGELIAFLRTDGCDQTSVVIAQNKAFTAARTGVESRVIGDRSKAEGFPPTNFGEPRIVGWGGGVPIVVDGEVVGAVGVSGLPEETDMILARSGADLIAKGS